MTMFHTARRTTMTQTLRVPAPQAAMRLTPLAYAVAVLLAAGGTLQQAQAQQAFSGAWFAGKGATQATAVQTGRQPGGVPLAGRPAAPGAQTGEQLQRSLNNLNLAARAIAAQQAAQAQARQGAAAAPGVPDGLVNGGLKIDANSLTAGWLNAQAPVQTVQGGKTTVLVRQTADKAILNWETLNVGKDTTLSFQQQKDWAVLNRVNDPLARPSQIQGRIEGDGTVLLVNRNGIVFHGASQVDTRNLVAAAAGIGDAQFRERGIYSNGSAPSISDALGKVDVLRGARLAARAPANSTEGGGYVLLAGAEVHNGGEILAPKGQALLAAGDSFVIRKGVGTDGNALSTTRGNEVVPRSGVAGATGKVTNSGLIQAREGDATLAGREVRQDGVLLASTSVNARGTVHLQALGEQAAVVLGQGATTAVLIEEEASNTALDSQRDGLRAPAVAGAASMLPLADRRDQSRIAIDSAGTVDFQDASLTLATGGQISVNAAGRSLVRDGARIDVAGAAGVRLAMESNNVKVNVQGNEQRDAPGNRDGKGLNSSDIWLDRRSLVFVPKGANGYDSDRWYTAGGLLEVGGYLGMQGHTVGEWMAQGGTLSFDGKDVVTQSGSSINLSGGTLRVEGGSIRQTWVNGADGRQYEASRAPGDLLYTGLYRGFEELHARWGESATASYRSPLIAPLQRLENGYTVGRDAGKLVIGTQAAVLEGLIDAAAVQGPGQQQAAQAGVDGYHQSHKAAATRGQLIVGRSVPMFEKSTGLTHDSLGAVMRDVQLAGGADDIAAGLDLGTLLPTSRQGRLVLDTARLNGFELGAIRMAATDTIAVNGAVRVADGGNVTLYGSAVAVNADVTAHAGSIQIGNILRQAVNDRIEDSLLKAPPGGNAGVQVAGGVTLDASGLWSQSLQEEESLSGAKLAYRHGGSVSLRSSGDVLLRQDSRIDVRSGAAQLAGGAVRGGKGGNVTLETRMQGSERAASLGFDGALLGQGMEGGGTLQVRAAKVQIGAPAQAAADTLQLDSGFFDKGFSRYDIGGNGGLTVADGAQVAVTMPLLRLAGQEVEAWLSPVYREDARKGVLTQRLGASLRLQAGVADVSGGADMASVQARIGHGAKLEVDPGQSITVAGIGQLTLDGRLNAWGGKIVLEGMAGDVQAAEVANGAGHGRSIWIGDGAVLDVAARAATAVDARGQRYGLVRDGGSIVVGGTLDHATGKADAAHLFVAMREGALLDASGTQAQLDVAGLGATQVASRGGSIALASNNGLYLDGQMKAGAGGASAAGGTLALALETPLYRDTAGARVRQAREFMLRQQPAGGTLAATQPEQAAAQFVYGHAALAASQVAAGGFGNLSILSNGMLGFDGDLSLSLGQSLHLYAPTLVLADGAAAATRVLLAAPYMRLAGIGAVGTGDGQIRPTVTGGVSTQPAAGTLRLEAMQLLDVRDVLTTGAHGGKERAQGLPMVLDRRAFDSVELASQGDLRFLGATVSGQNTALNTPADLSLTAARIYPATGANAIVRVGYLGGGSDYAQQRLLRIGRAGTDGQAPPLPPSSAFGALTLGAAAIEQGGVLLAPLGSIVLGASTGASMSDTRSLRFLPGSVTSVSGAGMMLPYGGTADGVSWSYDGQDVSLLGAGGTYGTTANLKVGLAMKSRAVDVLPGAVLDLSGGGQLLGAAFVAGRGGSTDARYHPLVQTRANGGFILPELASNPVYAIVPGAQAPVAPADGERGASVPVPGQQVTIGAGVPGLPAGSYTLLPSTYALLPGAFRIEINGQAGIAPAAPNAMRNGSWAASGRLSVAGTGIGDALSRQLIVTPASVLRSYSQYRETSYADFVRADAARLDVPRAMLEADARTMLVQLMPGNGDALDFRFQGQARFQPADKGHGGTLAFPMDGGHLEVLAASGQASADIGTASLRAVDVNAVGAARLSLGSLPVVRYGQGGNLLDFSTGGAAGAITVRDGASLSAAEVLLIANSTVANQGAGIKVEQGAAISTLGRGKSAFDAEDGFVYQPGYRGVLAVSNGRLQMLAPEYDSVGTPASIRIGTCAQAACAGATSLYSEGSIAFATSSAFELGDAVRYGTRHLTLAVGGINVGSAQALDAAAARGALPPGLTLNQEVLDRLLRGDASTGAPALQTLSLTAAQSLNFYGDATLSTMDASGKSLLDKLSLTTPAMYGGGKAGEAARIVTDTLVWNGGTAGPAALPGAVLAGGAGTGSGTLDVNARRIEFGYGPDTRPDTLADAQRLILGFADVRLNASERITANHKGSLAVHQSQGAYAAGKGYAYAGGDLYLNTPLLTGQAGSVNRITAGGALNIAGAGAGLGGPAALAGSDALGAELLLAGNSVTLDTAVVLPSGKLTLAATGDVRLLDGAQLDMAGRKVSIHDADKYSWGGEVILTSRSGNIAQAAAAGIDVSARNNQGGKVQAIALDAGAGKVDLQGRLLGGASGRYDAGGTVLPYKGGVVDIRAQDVGDFAALNRRLNDGKVDGERSFQIKRGDLTIGDEIRAGSVNVSLDNGRLTVAGTIDASGERVGSIRLAGKHGVTLAGTAVLDAHGSVLRVDSYGKIIDAPNRALIEINAGDGVLALDSGARLDVRHGTAAGSGADKGRHDGKARGTLDLHAARLGSAGGASDADAATHGDIAIAAGAGLRIEGAREIAVHGTARYSDAPQGVLKDVSGQVVPGPDGLPQADLAAGGRPYQYIDQAYLDSKHGDSTDFMAAALGNANLLENKLAGLRTAALAEALHVRPGVEIVTQGDLVVSGDIDLSAHRYAGLNAKAPKTAVAGSGEPGSLVLRAGGNLDIFGSINDGFAPPPATPDDKGWVLTPGRQAYGADVVVPGHGVVLAEGTLFPAGKVLNYALPIQSVTLAVGTVLPVAASLAAALEVPLDTVLRADVRDSAGRLLHAAGTLVAGQPLLLPKGTQMGAGSQLPGTAALEGLTWPAGVPLPSLAQFDNYLKPNGVMLASALALRVGALIPADTRVKLPGGALSVPLRAITGGVQGRNWAVAPMLPEGSLSWSMRLVSGADTGAADTRSIRPVLAGDLRLADSHYALYETYDRKIIPGTPARPGGAWFWNAFGGELGYEPGTPVAPDLEDWCDAGACDRYNYAWSDSASLYDPAWLAGKPVPLDVEGLCDADLCIPLGKAIPGTPDRVEIGALKSVTPATQHFSVLRTGTGDLDLIAAGNVSTLSPYGIYTAGTSTASLGNAAYNQARGRAGDGATVLGSGGAAYESLVDGGAASPYAAWYPDHGGNVLLRAGGNLTGDIVSAFGVARQEDLRRQAASANVGNWLWRQGTGGTAGVDPIPASWWINFGTYIKEAGGASVLQPDQAIIDKLPMLVGFTGMGTLGGGNLSVDVGGHAGMQARRGSADGNQSPRSEGLVLAVAGTGRVGADGGMLLTGGGDMDVRIGGDLNPGLQARAAVNTGSGMQLGVATDYQNQNLNLNGALSNLRGALALQTGSLGGVAFNYGGMPQQHDSKEQRAYDPYGATLGTATGGATLMLGDAAARVSTRGDLVLAGTGDPGRVKTPHSSAFTANGKAYAQGGYGWFSLWTDGTAIDLFSAGGSLAPSVQLGDVDFGRTPASQGNHADSDGRFLFPSQLGAVAAHGSIFLGKSALGGQDYYAPGYSMLLAPSASGRLDLLAGDSLYASGYAVSRSGAAASSLATPVHPAFAGYAQPATYVAGNGGVDGILSSLVRFPLFAFGSPSAAPLGDIAGTPSRLYAGKGDIVGLRSGELLAFANGQRAGQTWYEGVAPVWMRAGRDIVNSGTQPGQPTALPNTMANTRENVYGNGVSTGNLFVHARATDVSIVAAGRDILHSSFNVAGPGTLELTAGRHIRMEEQGALVSLGAVVAGDQRPGAGIVLQAGLGDAGVNGVDFAAFAQRYLDPANLAQAGVPLAQQAGKVARTYAPDLAAWLAAREGFSGTPQQARTRFAALPPEQQRIFARQVFFDELKAGGREYNDAQGPRFGSYLRGRNAIAALFPAQDAHGRNIRYQGDISLYGPSGVNTLFGGDISMLAPGGKQVFGTEGQAPLAVPGLVPGVLTQGAGDIALYAQDSMLLGQSRIMTTFGGAILGWSALGDINAGRGSKSTIVYTPPKRVYDQWGNVTLASDVPSTGAGIATLAPIPEVPAGDIDLIAPLGTIDAGEAGIRVSGNINLAALQVVNAANIQVQGKSSGMPVLAAVNVAALSNASAAASQATGAAQEVLQRERAAARGSLPSIFSVRVLGFGDEPVEDGDKPDKRGKAASYRPDSPVAILGLGGTGATQRAHLTRQEQQELDL